MNNEILIAIAGAALVTYCTRFPLMILSGKREIPPRLARFMRFIAPAVLTALIVPSIFVKDGAVAFSHTNPYLWAAAITTLAAWLSKNMLVSVITGLGVMGLWMMLFM